MLKVDKLLGDGFDRIPSPAVGNYSADFARLAVNGILISPVVIVDVQEVKRPDLDAQLVAENVAMQLEKRIAFRRAMKKVVQSAMSFGAGGIRVRCSGRLGGAEIARTEEQKDGCVPLHTIRAGVEYGFAEANTSAGKIGIKCWLLKSKDDFLVAKKDKK